MILKHKCYGRLDEFEVVGVFPDGYVVWNIGRRNFPFEGYIPLTRLIWNKELEGNFNIDLSSLKAIKVKDEETALRIMKLAMTGQDINASKFYAETC